ncbi:hypothetical protein FB451DRAFT_1188817 [Mycena latifolia]|nr:hypothetical protein FB451DRAFT_1188817 [Mycena latifolia]
MSLPTAAKPGQKARKINYSDDDLSGEGMRKPENSERQDDDRTSGNVSPDVPVLVNADVKSSPDVLEETWEEFERDIVAYSGWVRPNVELTLPHIEASTHFSACPAIPCGDIDDLKQKQACLMLVLFKPWRHAHDLRNNGESWADTYLRFCMSARTAETLTFQTAKIASEPVLMYTTRAASREDAISNYLANTASHISDTIIAAELSGMFDISAGVINSTISESVFRAPESIDHWFSGYDIVRIERDLYNVYEGRGGFDETYIPWRLYLEPWTPLKSVYKEVSVIHHSNGTKRYHVIRTEIPSSWRQNTGIRSSLANVPFTDITASGYQTTSGFASFREVLLNKVNPDLLLEVGLRQASKVTTSFVQQILPA